MKRLHVWKVALGLLGVCLPLAAQGTSQSGYQQLVTLDKEFLEFAKPKQVDGIPDYGSEAMKAQKKGLENLRQRLAAIDADSWPTNQKVDYLLVWARLNELDFAHRVMRPWARDPTLYLDLVNRLPYIEVPVPEGKAAPAGPRKLHPVIPRMSKTEFRNKLQAVPEIMAEAQTNLTVPVGELAHITLFHLENFDGVGAREPYRDEPPDGTIGWYQDLCERLAQHQSDLVSDCQNALKALEGYRDWLKAKVDEMPQSAAIGIDNFNWYLKYVRLVPFTVDELEAHGERELQRYRVSYIIERNKNRNLPELKLTESREEHEERTRKAEQKIRALIAWQDLLTIPDYMPPEFETDVFWSSRAPIKRHFWEEIQFRNALNNHIHASIPGHRFDVRLRDHLTSPIRRTYNDWNRRQGWAVYLEEMFVLAGLTDDNPRAAELFYAALMKRASRIFAETKMHSGEFTLAEANQLMIDSVPFMEEDLGRYDLEGYLRRPGGGSSYQIGKIQVEQLMFDRATQLGDEFNLKAFHDEFLSKGIIPVTLIRWEMTGLDDEVKPLWVEAVGPQPSED
jgi:hypothetical protein